MKGNKGSTNQWLTYSFDSEVGTKWKIRETYGVFS